MIEIRRLNYRTPTFEVRVADIGTLEVYKDCGMLYFNAGVLINLLGYERLDDARNYVSALDVSIFESMQAVNLRGAFDLIRRSSADAGYRERLAQTIMREIIPILLTAPY